VKRGDVVLSVLQGDLGKPRPAVIVQADELGPDRATIIVCPVSSDIADTPFFRPAILPSRRNGLREPSMVMVDKIIAVRRERLRAIIGSLETEDGKKSRPGPVPGPRTWTDRHVAVRTLPAEQYVQRPVHHGTDLAQREGEASTRLSMPSYHAGRSRRLELAGDGALGPQADPRFGFAEQSHRRASRGGNQPDPRASSIAMSCLNRM
jgi:mRNA interferase MazF